MGHTRVGTRLVGVALATGLVLVACDGSDGEQVAGDQETADGPAALGIIEPGVDVADEPAEVAAAEFRAGEDGEGLVVADLVRTDSAGFAEVRWTTGALARLDVDTLLEVTELDLEEGQPRVTIRLDAGRVWSRLQEGSADYEVVTDVGTAAVRGTGFLVSCAGSCTFGIAEGVLAVTTALGIELELRPGEQVTVDGDGAPGDIEPFDHDDAWVRENIRRDREAGFPAIDEPDGDDGRTQTARGRIDGSYQFTFTVQESTQADLEGQQVERNWVWFPTCDEGPCGGQWDPGDGNREPFRWTGQGYTAAWIDRPAGSCPDGSPRWEEDFVLTLTPTAVADGDAGVVTELDARWVSTLTPLPAAVESGCDPGEGDVDQVLTGSGVLAEGASAN